MSDSSAGMTLYYETHLIDDDCNIHFGDFVLHPDGRWWEYNGYEDIQNKIEGKSKVITRSFQNWHTHLPMVLNRGMGEGLTLGDTEGLTLGD